MLWLFVSGCELEAVSLSLDVCVTLRVCDADVDCVRLGVEEMLGVRLPVDLASRLTN